MDDFIKTYIDTLRKDKPFNNWTGYNMPSEIELKSNIWVSKAGARIFKKGFYYDPEVSSQHIEWGAVVDGEMLIKCADRKIKLQKGMFYLMPDSINMVAKPLNAPFLVWIEFTGNLSKTVFEIIGGKMGELLIGHYNWEQLKTALNIAYLLQYHPPRYNLSVQSMLWRFISLHPGMDIYSNKFSGGIQKTIEYIHDMPVNDDVTISHLASISMLSVETFRKRFHNEVGEAPKQYLLRYRITKAKEQLVDTSKSIKQIAYESGFSDPYYFSRLFKQYEGLSPLLFRKKLFTYLES
jgi:AraC-like DNA-binding protein